MLPSRIPPLVSTERSLRSRTGKLLSSRLSHTALLLFISSPGHRSIERVPEQVLRFYRLPDVDDPQPLWANDRKIKREDVSDCPVCKGLRQVEFQVCFHRIIRHDCAFASTFARS